MDKQRRPLKRTPTPRQRKAAQLIAENSRADKPKSLRGILLEAGYSQDIADRPRMVTQSDGFLAILDEAGVTDDNLAKVLGDGLKDENSGIRHKYLETGLRLRGHGKTSDLSVNFNNFAQNQRNDYQLS